MQISKENIETFLMDMSYNTHFEFLEEGAQKDELTKIAEKRGIKLPCHDLAVFKGRYAYVDRMNKNKCILPKEEVEKALTTLVGKAVDFDHLRKNVVGYWVDGKIEGDEIIAYGIFFKGNFTTEYEDIKKMMTDDVLAISFEAWGNRNFGANGAYSLTDIEFAGGALLIKTEPAFPGSEVMEMSNKGKVLEMAKVMTPPANFLHTGDIPIPEKKELEQSRYHMMDIQSIARQLAEVDCLNCSEVGFVDVHNIDFFNNKASVKCLKCETEMAIDLVPSSVITKKGKKIKEIKKNEIPCHTDDTEESALAPLDKTESNENQEEQNKMKGLIEKYKDAVVRAVFQAAARETVQRELADEELALAYSVVDYKAQKRAGTLAETRSLQDLKGQSTASPTSLLSANILDEDIITAISEVVQAKIEVKPIVNEELAKISKELDETKKLLSEAQAQLAEIEKAKMAAQVKTRRDELGEEFAKDLKDEEIMNEDKFAIAQLKKENAELKKGTAPVVTPADLTKGSADKDINTEKTSRSKVKELAFGKSSEKEDK